KCRVHGLTLNHKRLRDEKTYREDDEHCKDHEDHDLLERVLKKLHCAVIVRSPNLRARGRPAGLTNKGVRRRLETDSMFTKPIHGTGDKAMKLRKRVETVLIIGKDAREHALAWKIAQSKRCKKLYVAPGNAGTALVAENVDLSATDINGLLEFALA